jgi:Rhs family protein
VETENSASLTELTWNDRGWLISAAETVQEVRNPQAKETRYSYDDNGNITGITYPDGAVVSHAYNALNLPAALVDGSMSITYTYDHEGQLSRGSSPRRATAMGPAPNTPTTMPDCSLL